MEKKLHKRNIYLDVIKAFAIICVVLGHCIQYGSGAHYLEDSLYFDNLVFKIIYSFHMPLFTLISGYLFAFTIEKDLKEVIHGRFKSLIIPIAMWSLISFTMVFLSQILSIDNINVISLLKKYLSIFFENLWFLWAIFWCSIIVLIVKNLFKDFKIIYIFIILLSFFIPDIGILAGCKFVYPFFVIGYFYNKDNLKEKLKKTYTSISLLVFGFLFIILLLFYNRDSFIYISGHYIFQGVPIRQFFIDLYRFVIGLIGSVFILFLFYKIVPVIKGKFLKCIKIIGENTLGIYIISGYFLSSSIFLNITATQTTINYLITIIETISVVLVSLICTLIIKKSNILNKLLLGGRK